MKTSVYASLLTICDEDRAKEYVKEHKMIFNENNLWQI